MLTFLKKCQEDHNSEGKGLHVAGTGCVLLMTEIKYLKWKPWRLQALIVQTLSVVFTVGVKIGWIIVLNSI